MTRTMPQVPVRRERQDHGQRVQRCASRGTPTARSSSGPDPPDHRRNQMESPIEVVRRFCAAWSGNMGAAELAAFFTEDAIYHNIPLEPVTGRENIATIIASVLRPGPPGIES